MENSMQMRRLIIGSYNPPGKPGASYETLISHFVYLRLACYRPND